MDNLSSIEKKIETFYSSHERIDRGKPKAAVIVPFVEINSNPYLLMIKRSMKMNKHPGQISFPGGKIEKGETARIAAIRESYEEVGITSENIELIRKGDDFFTPYYNSVTPFYAKVTRDSYFVNSINEIDYLLLIPLEELFNPQSYHVENWERDGEIIRMHFYNWYDNKLNITQKIWGASASVIYKLNKIIMSN